MNTTVTITAVYFDNHRGLKSFPRRMEYDGREYEFRDGLSYRYKSGDIECGIYDMNDGNGGHYRLLHNIKANSWILKRIVRTV
jgi:hypothetical protein